MFGAPSIVLEGGPETNLTPIPILHRVPSILRWGGPLLNRSVLYHLRPVRGLQSGSDKRCPNTSNQANRERELVAVCGIVKYPAE